MSRIPDDKWIFGDSAIRPQDKQLCVIIPKDDGIPAIYQYRRGLFYDTLTEVLLKKSNVGYNLPVVKYEMKNIECWKPLGLPASTNERIIVEIEKWFEEDELN